jgi:hypothetical protein
MTHSILAVNVNDALYIGLLHLAASGVRTGSRNGTVVRAPGPVVTSTRNPLQRVLFSPLRDANPFFHLYESVWMLAGRNDAASVARYAGQMSTYSDDGTTLHGAYGHRWRKHFGCDQLKAVVRELRENPTSRRVVLSMWDPGSCSEEDATFPTGRVAGDTEQAVFGKDVPCNTHCYFDLLHNRLSMTVCCRSNDAVWGAHGANAVHFGYLLDFVAAMVGVEVGTLVQVSNNYHVYIDRPDVRRLITQPTETVGGQFNVVYFPVHGYSEYELRVFSLRDMGFEAGATDDHLAMLETYADVDPNQYEYPVFPGAPWFLTQVFAPMMRAHAAYKAGLPAADCMEIISLMEWCDWRVAGEQWLARRFAAKAAKA